jgi:ribokinase
MQKKLIVIGSANNDLVIEVGKAPIIGETVLGSGFLQVPGGKGANQAVAAARLGANVTFIGAVGDDVFGVAMIKSFVDNGVDASRIRTVPGTPTGTAMIILYEGDNYIAVDQGANLSVSKEQVDSADELIKEADMAVLQLEIPFDTVQHAVMLCNAHRVPVLLNPAPAPKETLDAKFLELVDLLTPNAYEAFTLTGIMPSTPEEAEKAAKHLTGLGAKSVVITLGGNGCVYGSGMDFRHMPASSVEDIVDTTAAGDSFSAALAVSLIEGGTLEEAVTFATKVGGITVTRKGAQPSLPFRNEII